MFATSIGNCRRVNTCTTPLHYAAQNGNLSALLAFLCAGADVNAADISGMTALHYAAARGHLLAVQALIARGAAIDPVNVSGATPLSLACANDALAVAAHLVVCGASVERKDNDGIEPLMHIVTGVLPDLKENSDGNEAGDGPFEAVVREENFSDLTLSGKKVHKSVLAARLKAFDNYFTEHSGVSDIDISDVPEVVDIFVDFIYKGWSERLLAPMNATLNSKVLIEILRVALRWSFDKLIEAVSILLTHRISESNVLSIWKVLTEHAAAQEMAQKKAQKEEDGTGVKQPDNAMTVEQQDKDEIFYPLSWYCPVLYPYLATVTVKTLVSLGGAGELRKVLSASQLAEMLEFVVLRHKGVAIPASSAKVPVAVAAEKPKETKAKTSSDVVKKEHNALSSSDSSIARRVLDRTMRQPLAEVFNHPVDPERDNAPDYLTVIKKPMDLGTIKSKLRHGKYHSLDGFVSDVRLVFKNARAYNGEGSYILQCVDEVSSFFEEEWKSAMKEKTKQKNSEAKDTSDYKESRHHRPSVKQEKSRDKKERRRSQQDYYDKPYGSSSSTKTRANDRRINPEFLGDCKAIIDQLLKHEFSGFFDHPVDPIADSAPDYFAIIKKPMDLSTVKSKLRHNEYRSLHHFAEDVRLIWTNCSTYNPAGSSIVAYAEGLKQLFETEYKKLKEKVSGEKRAAPEESQAAVAEKDAEEDEKINLANWLCGCLGEMDEEQQGEAISLVSGEFDKEAEYDLGALPMEKLRVLEAFVNKVKNQEPPEKRPRVEEVEAVSPTQADLPVDEPKAEKAPVDVEAAPNADDVQVVDEKSTNGGVDDKNDQVGDDKTSASDAL